MDKNGQQTETTKKPTVLVSAFACRPNEGSEPGIGWNWVQKIIEHGHEAIVLTHSANRKSIENHFKSTEKPTNLSFFYFSLPFDHLFSIESLRYMLWESLVFIYVINKVKNSYDIIHHVTYCTFRFASSLCLIPKKIFIWGPCGGGDLPELNLALYCAKEPRDLLHIFSRFITLFLTWLNPLQIFSLYKAKSIFLTTPQSKKFIPPIFWHKTFISTNIGIATKREYSLRDSKNDDKFKILFVGRFIYWKGIKLAIDALKLTLETTDNIELILIGDGEYKQFINDYITRNNLNEYIKIINWLPQKDLWEKYQNSDIFLFPSLHDSSGSVILEAFSFSLPVICLNNAGPGFLVDSSSGLKVDTKNKSSKEIIFELSETIIRLVNDSDLRINLGKGAFSRSQKFTWENLYNTVYSNLTTIETGS